MSNAFSEIKHAFKSAVAMILCMSLLFASGCAGTKSEPDGSYDVRVIIRCGEGVSVEGDSIVDTKSGRTVTFKINVGEGYVYIGNSAGAEYNPESGKLRLSQVFAPTTVDVYSAREDEVIRLDLRSNNPEGMASAEADLFAKPEEVDVRAECPEYLSFEGWSEGGFLKDGGTLLSENLNDTFYIDASKTLYANFAGFSEYRIIYNLCGGTAPDGEDTYTALGSYKDIYAMQQTLESNGTFKRDGYVAVGYSTEPAEYEDFPSANDIPGFSNMGGVCRVYGESLELNVVWAKESPADDFLYDIKEIPVIKDVEPWGLRQKTEDTEGVEILKYLGDDKTVVIPEQIEGKKVLSIASGAFSDEAIERAVIPRTVVNIEKEAFSGCENLYEVVLFDSVATVYDESFNKSLKTVVLNAQRLPVYSGEIEGSFCIKYDRMRTCSGNMIAVVSGSSSLNGLDSELFEELMPGYTVVNYGTNAANPSLFFLEVLAKYADEGDIVVHAPEYSSSASMGSNSFHAKVFRGNEQCYDIFRDVDISHYDNFWDSFRQFQIGNRDDSSLVPALHLSGKEYQLEADVNKYGDIAVSRPSVRGSFGGSTEDFSKFRLDADNLNSINELYEASGAKLLMSFGTFDKARLYPTAATEEEYDRFTQKCADALDYPVISNVGTYIMEHKYFYDSEWHPNEEGAKIRTENLANDIKAYLSAPELY